MERKKLVAILVSSVLLLLALPCFAAQYAITDLGRLGESLGGDWSYATALNNNGQVVGKARPYGPLYLEAFLWNTSSGMTGLGTLGGGESEAWGINNEGQVVGYSLDASGYWQPFIWSAAGGIQGLLEGASGFAMAINDDGRVVGMTGGSRAFLWSADGGPRDLGTLGGTRSGAYDINSSGHVVGQSETASGGWHAFLWIKDAGMQDLGVLPGATGSFARGINDNGQVVGESGGHAFLWTADGGMQDLGTLNIWQESTSAANQVNNHGQAVGQSDGHAVLWTEDGRIVDLNDVAEPAGWSLAVACDINDRGQIVGWGINPEGLMRGFLLTPIPEALHASVTVTPIVLDLATSKRAWEFQAASPDIGAHICCKKLFGDASNFLSHIALLLACLPPQWRGGALR